MNRPLTMTAAEEERCRRVAPNCQFKIELDATREALDAREQTIREQCAKVADKIAQYYLDLNLGYACTSASVAKEVAAEIRSASSKDLGSDTYQGGRE